MRATTLVLALLMSDAAFAQGVRCDLYGDPLPKGALMRLGTLRFRHGGETIRCMKYSWDGKFLATGGLDYSIRLWNAHTGQEIRRLAGHTRVPTSLAFSPDSKLLASGGHEDTLRLWDLRTGKCLHTIKLWERVHSIVFSRDGKWVISAGSGSLRVWDTATGKCLRTLKEEEAVCDLSISSDGKLLASTDGEERRICIREVDTGKLVRVWKQRKERVGRVRLAPDGKTLASTDTEGSIHLWDVAAGKEIRHWKAHEHTAESGIFLVFTAKGQTLLSGAADGIREWDAATGKQLRVLVQWPGRYPELCLSPDDKMLAMVAFDKAVRRWAISVGKEVFLPQGHEASVNSVRFAAKDKRLVSRGDDGSVRAWDLQSGKELHCDRTNPQPLMGPGPIALSADGRTLALESFELTVCLRDRITRKDLSAFPTNSGVNSLCFSPDGKFLAAGTYDDIIRVRDVAAAKECCRIKGYSHNRPPVFSPDSRLLATSDPDLVQFVEAPMRAGKPTVGGIHICESANGKEIQYISNRERHSKSTPLCFSPDGRMHVGWQWKASGPEVSVWEVATGRERFRFKPSRGSVFAAAFSVDGTMLAVGEKHVIHLWDVRAGQERQQFRSDQGEIHSLAFSEDGRQLASGGKNTTILLWPIPPSSWKRPTTEPELSAEKLQALWSVLAGEDAARAFDSMKIMAASPASTAAFLRQHLLPVSALDKATTQRLLARLDSDDLVLRERATKELEKLGDVAEHLLRQALRRKPTLELRRRAEVLLEKLAKETPERLRKRRALEVLEWLDTVEAHRLLEELAGGAADAWLTGEAERARHRQHRSSEPRP